jgi:hypothetical protein
LGLRPELKNLTAQKTSTERELLEIKASYEQKLRIKELEVEAEYRQQLRIRELEVEAEYRQKLRERELEIAVELERKRKALEQTEFLLSQEARERDLLQQQAREARGSPRG